MNEKVDDQQELGHSRLEAANDSARIKWQGPVQQQQPRMSAALRMIHQRQQEGGQTCL